MCTYKRFHPCALKFHCLGKLRLMCVKQNLAFNQNSVKVRFKRESSYHCQLYKESDF